MKNFLNIPLTGLLVALCLFGCEKSEVKEVDFDAVLQQQTYKVGDSVRFNLSGYADIITFYSGAAGNNYEATKTQVLDNKVILSFDGRKDKMGQLNQLTVLASTNFSGTNSFDALNAATWKDITDKFAMPSVSTDFVPSGSIDLTAEIRNLQPFYIAFKYAVKPVADAGDWAKWELKNFTFKEINEREEKTLLDLNLPASWTALLSTNYESSRVTNTTNGLVFQGNVTNIAEPHEAWLVTKVVYPNTTTNYKPDFGIAIKNMPQPARTVYATAYDAAGTYQIVFVAKNVKGDKSKEIIKKLTVKIEP